MKVRAAEAIELQDEIARFWLSRFGHDFAEGWRRERERAGYQVLCGSASERLRVEVRGVLGARTYWVSEEMMRLALHAARSMPPQPLYLTDLPCPSGMAFFEQPLTTPDVHGITTSAAAFRWERCQAINDGASLDGVMWSYYSDMSDRSDEYMQKLRAEGIDPERYPARMVFLGEDYEGFGRGEHSVEKAREYFNFQATVEQLTEAVIVMRRLPLALFALMGQKIAVVAEREQERHARKRLARAHSLLADSVLRVVILRRPASAGAEVAGQPVNWAHRWIVSGHWRNQWLPSVQRHRLQWIAPFVKGPEDKPLAIKRTVHALVR